MPAVGHVGTLDPTTIGRARVRFLLDLTIAGRVFRVSDGYFDVMHENGTVLAYVDGLDGMDWDQRLSLFADSPGEVSVPFEILLPDVDWAELRAAGHDLAAGSAELSRWVEGTSYGQRQRLLVGIISEPTFGALGEPFAFSVDTVPLEDTSSWPIGSQTVSTGSFEDPPEDSLGTVWPQVIGTCGWVSGLENGGRISGSPATAIANTLPYWLIAGHRVRATKVWWRDVSDPVSTWASTAVLTGTSLNGLTYSYIDLTFIVPAGSSADIWISWSPCAGGEVPALAKADLNDNETFGLDDGINPLVTFEFKTTGGYVATPGAVTIDLTVGIATAEEVRDKMVEVINEQNFTIRAAKGPSPTLGSLSLVILANRQPGTQGNTAIPDTVAHAGFTGNVVPFDGGLNEYGGLEDPAHGGMLEGAGDVLEFFLQLTDFGVDHARTSAARADLNAYKLAFYVDEAVTPYDYVRTHVLPLLPVSIVNGPDGLYPVIWRHAVNETRDSVERLDVQALDAERVGPVEISDPVDVANSITLNWALSGATDKHTRTAVIGGSGEGAPNRISRVSFARYGQRVRVEDTDVVYDAQTAGSIVAWMSYAYGLPGATVSYSVEQARVLHLHLGDVVSLTDSELHLDGSLWHVVGLADDDSGFVELTLRSIDDPDVY